MVLVAFLVLALAAMVLLVIGQQLTLSQCHQHDRDSEPADELTPAIGFSLDVTPDDDWGEEPDPPVGFRGSAAK